MPEFQDFAAEPAQGSVPIDVDAMTARAQYFLDKARATSDPAERARYAQSAFAALPQTVKILDPDTGQIRDKTWWERNGDATKFLIGMAATFAGGFYAAGGFSSAGAGAGGAGSAGGNLATLGVEPAAIAGLPGGAAGLPAGSFAGGVGPEITASGLFGPGSAGFDALSQTQLNPGPAAVSPGNSGISPGTSPISPTAPPTTPGVLTGDNIVDPGIGAGGVPASLAPTAGGTSMIPWAEIARYAIPAVTSLYTSNNAANASETASQQQQAAVREALALQERIYTQNRSDVQAQMQGLQPYQQAGPGAVANLQHLVANPYRGTSQTPQTGYQPQPFQPQPMPQVGGNLATLSAPAPDTGRRAPGMGTPTGEQAVPRVIQMRGPDGSVRPVLASEEQKWSALGAQRVN